jgi:hypothetical protein
MNATFAPYRQHGSWVLLVSCVISAAISSVSAEEKTVRLADGTILPLEQWPETYETMEWKEPIDVKKAKTIVDCSNNDGWQISSVGIDHKHNKLYWIAGPRDKGLYRSNLDGSNKQTLIKPGIEHLYCGLCVVPELGQIYWSAQGSRGKAVFRATLDGRNVTQLIADQRTISLNIHVDVANKKIYWNGADKLWRADLDGSHEEALPIGHPRVNNTRGTAVDFSNEAAYYVDGSTIYRQKLDGTDAQACVHFGFSFAGTRSLQGMFLDTANNYLYWTMSHGIVRAKTNASEKTELLVAEYGTRWFTVDPVRKKLYWVGNEELTLFSADLPQPWQTVTKPSPPLITSVTPNSGVAGAPIRLRGAHLATAERLIWIGHPSGEVTSSNVRVISDSELETVVPKMSAECRQAALCVIAVGGATVTLPGDLTVIGKKRARSLERGRTDNLHAFLVQADGELYDTEKKLVVVERNGLGASDRRAGDTYFVKNGGYASRLRDADPIALRIFEPHAQWQGAAKEAIAVGAIRPSFVEAEFKFER